VEVHVDEDHTNNIVIDEKKKIRAENKKLEEELSATNTALEMLKDENEVNKKNMLKFIEENKKLQEKVKAEHATGKQMYESFMAERSKVSTLQEEIKELSAENEQLKDFTNWENHPALKHKVVLDDDYYLEHLGEDGELIHPEELEDMEKLKEELDKLRHMTVSARREAFWRMCESYNGFHSNTNIRDPQWLGEMDGMIDDRYCDDTYPGLGTVEELQQGYRDWVGGEESEDEDA